MSDMKGTTLRTAFVWKDLPVLENSVPVNNPVLSLSVGIIFRYTA
jgi:hypothetical protein